MPEYLAPGVYVEEVSLGTKPIEGVSTSTGAMVGVTERGPVNVPTLVTSFGDFTRRFGEFLNIIDYSNEGDAHCYLPHAVQGFFANGGRRLYVTRVVADGASNANLQLFDRGTADSAETVLLRSAGELTGTAASPPRLLVLSDAGLEEDGWIRIGDGSHAEYRQLSGAPAADNSLIPIGFPLGLSHARGDPLWAFTGEPDTAFTAGFVVAEDAGEGDRRIALSPVAGDPTNAADDLAALAAERLIVIEVGSGGRAEHRIIQSVVELAADRVRVTLETPLVLARAKDSVVTPLAVPSTEVDADALASLDQAAEAGSALLFATDRTAEFATRNNLILVSAGGTAPEVRRVGALSQLTLSTGAYDDYPAGSRLEEVGLAEYDRSLSAGAFTDDISIELNDVNDLESGDQLVLDPRQTVQETVTIRQVDEDTTTVHLVAALQEDHALGAVAAPAAKRLTATAGAGSRILALNNRLGLAEGNVIQIGESPNDEYLTITAIPKPSPSAPNAGTLVLDHALRHTHGVDTPVWRQRKPAVTATAQVTVLALDTEEYATRALITDGTDSVAEEGIRMTTASGDVFYHRLSSDADSSLAPNLLTLNRSLDRSHAAGSAVVARQALIEVRALDPGSWGNRLRVSVEDEETGLVSETTLRTVIGPLPYRTIRLASAAGVEPGTVLELLDPADESVVGEPVKVEAIDRSSDYTITLAGDGLSQQQHDVFVDRGLGVRSRELRLWVRLLRQPDPAVPSRDSQVIDSELFDHLSMDPRHTRYIHRIIGTTWEPVNAEDDDGNPLRRGDRRSQGASRYVRVRDLAETDDEVHGVRLGPEGLTDGLPDGRSRSARHVLQAGGDSVLTLVDDDYIGVDHPIPENRTGLQALTAVDEVSLVACPGRTSAWLQGRLINHCEQMRYRFAILDGPVPPNDSLNDVRAQRQQFDTKYAALYYPWLMIRDPFPSNLSEIPAYPIPCAGHMMGIYARTDIERGVHKAPANQVVRGILRLTRTLNKGEHDILNPSPVNINVIRDFRRDNRGIRVWGGRVITSDTEYKYVNVRRLLIFIEKSIDRGLQWVVFEPNAQPLWAKVRRAIANFLKTLWRDGALEGSTPEEAFFVKCDRTTMTQTDIDNGRLICVVGVAAVKPAEFVIVRIGLWTAHAED